MNYAYIYSSVLTARENIKQTQQIVSSESTNSTKNGTQKNILKCEKIEKN